MDHQTARNLLAWHRPRLHFGRFPFGIRRFCRTCWLTTGRPNERPPWPCQDARHALVYLNAVDGTVFDVSYHEPGNDGWGTPSPARGVVRVPQPPPRPPRNASQQWRYLDVGRHRADR